jgi:hypothetical protein
VLAGLIYLVARRYPKGVWVVAAAVFSHWVLDLIVHRPDLPLIPGNPIRVGLGVWNSIPATYVVEFGLYATGVALYLRTTTATDRVGRYALWALVAVLAVTYVGSQAGPPPPSAQAIGIVGLGGWLFVPWGYWIDRHRRTAGAASP